MKSLIPAFALLAAVASPFPAFGAYVRGDLVWKCDFTPAEAARHELDGRRFNSSGYGVAYEPDGGRDGDGALRFRTPDQTHTAVISIRPDVPLAGVLLVEADVKGVEIGPGLNSWNGPKVMLPYELPSNEPGKKGKTSYPQLPGETGTFDWKTWVMVRDFGEPASGPSLVLGLEKGAGDFRVDSVRVYRAREVPDEEVVPPAANEAAAKIPRGAFAGRHNPDALRGTMVGGRMEEDDVATLASWGANLVRIQLGGAPMREAASTEAYFAALSNRLDWCEAAMDRCARHGIKVVVDLHCGPDCIPSKNASNMFPDDYDPKDLVRAWAVIATRLKDHPATYAYDILNEPSGAGPDTLAKMWRVVMAETRRIDPRTPFVVESPRHWYEGENVIYSPHFYSPHDITHYGVGASNRVRWNYPGYVNGVWWDKEQMRVALGEWIEFQRRHPDARILVGEFSCILWSKGADAWIRDAIGLFEEYGWSWCYHAYREWSAWDVEYTHDGKYTVGQVRKAEEDTERKKALLEGLSFNGRGHPAEDTAASGDR